MKNVLFSGEKKCGRREWIVGEANKMWIEMTIYLKHDKNGFRRVRNVLNEQNFGGGMKRYKKKQN